MNNRFEIDSKCPDSDMVNKVKEEIKKQDNSLLEYGTWAYLGSPSNPSGRYLFWTSVDTNRVGAGTKIPVIVSKANGGFYISETTTAYRNKNKEKYVAIADHIHNDFGFQTYTKGEKYDTLKKAYEAYSKLLKEGKYSEYKYAQIKGRKVEEGMNSQVFFSLPLLWICLGRETDRPLM